MKSKLVALTIAVSSLLTLAGCTASQEAKVEEECGRGKAYKVEKLRSEGNKGIFKITCYHYNGSTEIHIVHAVR